MKHEQLLESQTDMCCPVFVFPVGHVEVVKLLVSRSADKSCKDKQGYTPLHAAAASGHIEIVKYLLRMGAEVSGVVDQSDKTVNLFSGFLLSNLIFVSSPSD